MPGHGSEKGGEAAQIKQKIVDNLRVWVEDTPQGKAVIVTLNGFHYHALREGGGGYLIDPTPPPHTLATLAGMSEALTTRMTG